MGAPCPDQRNPLGSAEPSTCESGSAAQELDALLRENAVLAEKLNRINCDNAALWEQLRRCKLLLLDNNVSQSRLKGVLSAINNAVGEKGPPVPGTNRPLSPFDLSVSPVPTDVAPLSTSHPLLSDSLPPSSDALDNSSTSTAAPLMQSPKADEAGQQGEFLPQKEPLPSMQKATVKAMFERASSLLKGTTEAAKKQSHHIPQQHENDSKTSSFTSSLPAPGSPAAMANAKAATQASRSLTTLPKPVRKSVWKKARVFPQEDLDTEREEGNEETRPAWGEDLTLSKHKRLHRRDMWRAAIEWASQPVQFNGRFRQFWDFILLLFLAYITVVVPYRVAFEMPHLTQTVLNDFEWVINAAFIVDIFISFRSTYVADGNEVTESRKLTRHYLQSWFICDLIAAIPAHEVAAAFGVHNVSGLGRLPMFLKILKLNKLVKLSRLVRLAGIAESLEALVPHRLLTIIKFCVLVLAVAHITACLFYFSAVLDDLDSTSWPAKYQVLNESNSTKYIIALYWACSTLCTVGYGDVVGTTTLERIYSIVAMLVGATVFAYFMGNMSVLVANIDQDAAQRERQMEAVNTFLRNRHIPRGLQERVREYYQYLWRHQVHSEEDAIISGLNSSLRTDVVLYMYRGMVERVPFFNGKHPQFISALVLCLKPEIYGPGDCIMWEGDLGHDMYFIVEGNVHVFRGNLARVLKAGQYFGEMALITGLRRNATCVAESYCELYSLSKESLELVLQDWPEIAEGFYSQAEKFSPEDDEDEESEALSPAVPGRMVENAPSTLKDSPESNHGGPNRLIESP